MNIHPIGKVHSTRKNISDDNWLKEEAYVELTNEFPADSLAGITDFSHVEILFHMNQVDPQNVETSARHPRDNTNWPKVGIFAQRGKNRPNQIGLTICDILKVEGRKLFVKGLDAVDGTPVLDIKPWMKEFGPRGSVRQPEWVTELMSEYWEVSIPLRNPSVFDPIVIDTEHVKIRPLQKVPWQKLADGLLYEDSFHAKSWGLKTPEDIRKMYENGVSAFQAKRGNPIVFLNQDETEVLGMTNFMNVEPPNKMIEIGGTWINKKWQKSYVNTETKFALLKYCFETLKINRVEFRIDFENLPSQKAVQRLGFHFDGLMPRRKVNANGHVRDYVFYSVTDQNWPEVKNHILSLIAKSKLPTFKDIQKAKYLRKSGDAVGAFEVVQMALKDHQRSADLNYLAACICDADRTEIEAVTYYLKALELGLNGHDRRDALLGLGSTYRSLGEYAKSKEIFETGIKEFPHYKPYFVFLALTEFNLKKPEQTVKILLDQLVETTSDQEIRTYERALRFYSTRLNEVFE
jgi:tRNA-Thr(GGU) m(6)t(6)A37 methyltransferase TsaA